MSTRSSRPPGRPPRRPDATADHATLRPARPRCPGCGAAIGEQHDRVCDVARCRATGLQWMACDTSAGAAGVGAAGAGAVGFGAVGFGAAVEHRPDVWTGRWPGEEDCERLGFLARFEPGSGWVPCAADDPDAVPHFDRLRAEATWDPHRGHWTA